MHTHLHDLVSAINKSVCGAAVSSHTLQYFHVFTVRAESQSEMQRVYEQN